MALGDADLDLMLADFGVPITFPGTSRTCLGIYEVVDSPMLTGAAGEVFAGRVETVVIKTGALGSLEQGDVVTVDGKGYGVVSVYAFDDGKFSRVTITAK